MLLAEINGKRVPEIEGLEDLFTSAVFGSLRLIKPQVFWDQLFLKALDTNGQSLTGQLQQLGFPCSSFEELTIEFWPRLGQLIPDLMLAFTGKGQKLLVTIEVKLNASMSNTDERNQLAAYAKLLNEVKEKDLKIFRPLVYLTPHSSFMEIKQSDVIFKETLASNESASLYSLEWQDVSEIANSFRGRDRPDLLGEVAQFLDKRGLVRFRRFRAQDGEVCGRFYQWLYFSSYSDEIETHYGGRFYAN